MGLCPLTSTDYTCYSRNQSQAATPALSQSGGEKVTQLTLPTLLMQLWSGFLRTTHSKPRVIGGHVWLEPMTDHHDVLWLVPADSPWWYGSVHIGHTWHLPAHIYAFENWPLLLVHFTAWVRRPRLYIYAVRSTMVCTWKVKVYPFLDISTYWPCCVMFLYNDMCLFYKFTATNQLLTQ